MNGVQLCARFSLATSRLQYCGPAGADHVLYRAVTEGRGLDEARAALSRFEALMPYLEALGSRNGLDPFDPQVVEAYWVGNGLLETFRRDDFLDLLEALTRRGLPRAMAERLQRHLPAHPVPHHLFHVCFVGVGNVTGHVETTLANMESCRPGFGTIVEVGARNVVYAGPRLELVNGLLQLTGDARSSAGLDPRMLPGVERGDVIATHWSVGAVELDADEHRFLQQYSTRALAAANEGLEDLRRASDPSRSGL